MPGVDEGEPEPLATEDSEADALVQELAAGSESEAASPDRKIDIYGFMDFTYTQGFGNDLVGWDRFAVGNVNLYLSSELADDWRSLAEVRFSYLPHGTRLFGPEGPEERVDTTVNDYTNVDRPVRWGGVIMERAWLEYSADPLLNVRMGQYLTPYGIWNIDHGSPVIIGVRQPYIIGDQLFPRSQTGIEVHGIYLVPPVKLGYYLTLSNGRGPIDTYRDLDGNKAVGGRLFARAETGAGNLVLGVSGYKGTYTDRDQAWVPTTDGGLSIEQPRTEFYREQSIATDFTWDWSGLSVQLEAIFQEIAYADDLRPAAFGFDGSQGLAPDHRRYGGYAQAGYRFAFGGIMPYAGYEYYDDAIYFGRTTEAWGGVNIRATPRVVLKGQYTYAWFLDFDAFDQGYNALELQAAWSF